MQLFEKYGALIERDTALIEKVCHPAVPPRWSASPGLLLGSCATETGCAIEATYTSTPFACEQPPSGCEKESGSGTCELIAPREEVFRVVAHPAVTRICPTGCLHRSYQPPIEARAETCNATRGYSHGACTPTALNTEGGCASIDNKADCDGTRENEAGSADDCVWAVELECTLDSTQADAAERCKSDTEGSQPGDCYIISAVTGQDEVEAQCFSGGVAGEMTFPGAKEASVAPPSCSSSAGDCVTQGNFMGNCTMVGVYFDTMTEAVCHQCWDHWQYKVTDEIKGNLWPATIAIFALFMFMFVLVCVNYIVVDRIQDESESKLLSLFSYVLNGLVCLFGLLVLIAGSMLLYDLTNEENCPKGQDCTNMAVVGVVVVGLCIFLNTIVSFVGLFLTTRGAKLVGVALLRITNLVYLVLGLALLIVGIGFAIIAGALDAVNKQYEDGFDDVRRQYESQDPTICAGMSDVQCKKKIMTAAAGVNLWLVIILGIVCLSFLFVCFLTMQAFYIYKSKDEDEDEDEDEGGAD
eukprot:SAG31_NODE_5991_length_2223_cov_1.492938_1_plen_526_part_00